MPLPTELQELLRDFLAGDVRPVTVEVLGRSYEGVEGRPPRDRDAWRRDSPLIARIRAADVRVYLSTPRAKAIWRLPPIDIIRFEGVGTHNREDDGWRDVQQLIQTVARGARFDIGFADTAGLELFFLDPISRDHARMIDTHLLDRMAAGETHWIDSYTSMLHSAQAEHLLPYEGADPRGGGLVPAYIATGRLLLWWD